MATRKELVGAVLERYRSSSAAERKKILDEFVAVSGYHRKHALRLLNAEQVAPRARSADRRRIYGKRCGKPWWSCGKPRTASAASACSC
jgi:hypothetical protein